MKRRFYLGLVLLSVLCLPAYARENVDRMVFGNRGTVYFEGVSDTDGANFAMTRLEGILAGDITYGALGMSFGDADYIDLTGGFSFSAGRVLFLQFGLGPTWLRHWSDRASVYAGSISRIGLVYEGRFIFSLSERLRGAMRLAGRAFDPVDYPTIDVFSASAYSRGRDLNVTEFSVGLGFKL